MTTFWLGINSCFAVKRWPRPPDWAAVVRDELGVDLVQHCADLVDIEAGRADLERQAADLRDGCAAAGLTLHSTFTGLAAYSANLLLHPDRERRGMGETSGETTTNFIEPGAAARDPAAVQPVAGCHSS